MHTNGQTDAPRAASQHPTAAAEQAAEHPGQPEGALAQIVFHGMAALLSLVAAVMGFSGHSGLVPGIGAAICVLLAHLSAPAPASSRTAGSAPFPRAARPALGIVSRLAFGAMSVFLIAGVLMLLAGRAPWAAFIGAAVSLLIGAFAIPDPARARSGGIRR